MLASCCSTGFRLPESSGVLSISRALEIANCPAEIVPAEMGVVINVVKDGCAIGEPFRNDKGSDELLIAGEAMVAI